MQPNSVRQPNSLLWAACAFLFLSAPLFPQALAEDSLPAPNPAARLDLSTIGYHQPSRTERVFEDEPSVTLNFVDAEHVLLTFNPKKLFHRLPDCPPDHQDRLVHAVVLQLPGGKVVNEADWYLHDRQRYLWPLGPGKFLLRKLNDLYVVDSSLHEKLLMSSPKHLLWVAVTPDGSQIVVETASEASPVKDPKSKAETSAAKPEPKFVAQFLDAKTLMLQRTLPLNEVVNLNGTSAGYVDLVHKGDLWLVRFGPSPTQRHNLARVRSRTVPSVIYSGNNSLLIGRCASSNCDYSVSAFTVTGQRLWRQHWSRYRFFPAVARNEDNSRFAVSTVQLAAAATAATKSDPVQDNPDLSRPSVSQTDVFQQQIQVVESASGNSVLSVNVSPAVLSGQNFSLSPDGQRLAVLQGAGLDLFDLPQMSEEERTKFSALKTDSPNLYSLASTPDSTADDSPADASAESGDATPGTVAEKQDDSASTGDAADANGKLSTAAGEDPPAVSAAAATTEPSTPTPADPVATFKVSTKAVVVDVVVTDAKGHPVHGLRPQDFQLEEDGKLQDARFFREFSNSDAPQTTAPTPTPLAPNKPAPNVFTNNTHAPDPGAVTLVLFDMLNTPSQDQGYARQQLIKFLQSKPKNSQFALCTMSVGSRLRLIQGFTPDETLLLAAAKGKKNVPKSVRWQASTEGTDAAVSNVTKLAAAGPTSGFQGLLSALQETQVQEQVADTDERAGITIDSMMLLARYLSGIPGRKNLVWLSGSFPISLTATNNSGNPAVDDPNYTYKIKRVTNLLAEAQIAVYPVDVRGLLSNGIGADSAGGMGGPTSSIPQDFSAGSMISPSPNIPQDMQALAQQAAERDTLVQFATATGGRAFYNTNGIREAIAIAAEQGSNYYTLSYTSTNRIYDGKFRKIRVRLAEKGYTLHYRQGYYADDANALAKDKDLSRRTRAVAMQHGSPPSRQVLFSVTVGPVGAKKKIDRAKFGDILASSKKPDLAPSVEAQHYSIDYTFEGSELRFTSLANARYRNVLTLMVTSFDKEGRMLSGQSDVGASDLEPAVYKSVISGEFRVHQEADVPVEAASLRVGIQDQMSNHPGTVEIALPVPPLPNEPRRRIRLPEIEPD